MKLPRRKFLHLAVGVAALPVVLRVAQAQSYPSRPVRLVVGFPASSATDIFARLLGQWLSERLGQQFLVENRIGAATNIATEAVVRAPPDGYTLLLVTPANAISATLYDTLNFNFIRDITPVASFVRVPFVMVFNPSFPAKTVPEFITYAKANPGKINMASGGIGTANHVAGELFKMLAGVNVVHVPSRGDPQGLLGGHFDVYFSPMPASIDYIMAGKLRALAVTTAERSQALPDVPTVAEFVAGYEASSWYGIGAPTGTPAEIVNKLNNEINAALVDPKLKARLADLGGTVLPGLPADFGRFIAAETEKWAKVIKFAGIKAE